MVDEGKIRERIQGYEAQKEEIRTTAERQITALNGAIQALEALLVPEDMPDKVADAED